MSNTGKETRKLLSLDGGGVRGMSSIAILRELMDRLATRRNVSVIHPWQEFDMIGGTSTGGLLAIMLGRLRMSIDQCEDVYVDLSERIFTQRRVAGNVIGQGLDFVNARGKFSTEVLEDAIKDVVKSRGISEDELFFKQSDDGCKVFVSVVRGEDGGNTVIRSYLNPDKPNPMRRYCRIWEAARATSAASTFYDPIVIGPNHQKYVDGALGYNNPIRLLDRESKEMWPDSDRIFISIGTGTAPGARLDGNIIELADRIKEIAIETEKTHEEFYQDHETTLVANHRYFRFNVEGLKRIGLEEHKARPDIYAATETYLESGFAGTMIKQLVGILRSVTPPSTTVTKSEDDTSPPTPASSQVTPRATTADSPTPKLSFAEKLQAKKQKAEATQKLFRAVSLNKVAQVKELLENGADPNVLGKSEGNFVELFPLYLAAKGKSNEVLHLLMEHKANLDGINTYYGTALHGAINNYNQEGVEALLAAGADPNIVNGMGYTPLQKAAEISDRDLGIVEALLMAEADVNAKTPHGTALDRALETGQTRTALVLLDNGADEDLARDSNYTSIQSLKASGN